MKLTYIKLTQGRNKAFRFGPFTSDWRSVNMASGPYPEIRSADDWRERWMAGSTKFHKSEPHPLLVDNFHLVKGDKQSLRVFVPLCGKTLDLKWLIDLGHKVVGVEASELAVQQFGEEHGISWTVRALERDKGYLYRSQDDLVRIYCCDVVYFEVSGEEPFDVIWDRASFVAINIGDRPSYINMIKSLMHPGCFYLLTSADYDDDNFRGPPHKVTREQILELYGTFSNVEYVAIRDNFTEEKKKWGVTRFDEVLYLLTYEEKR